MNFETTSALQLILGGRVDLINHTVVISPKNPKNLRVIQNTIENVFY